MKKILYFILCLTVVLSATSCYVGNGWQDTPEKALAIEADMNADNLQRLTPKLILDEFQMNEKTYMLFVSEGDTLVQASFATNEEPTEPRLPTMYPSESDLATSLTAIMYSVEKP